MKIEDRKLVEQILYLCEKQYRKGFQQGFDCSVNKEMTQEEVCEFRFRDNYRKTEHPHTGYVESKAQFAGRLELESPYTMTSPNSFSKLKRLLSEYQNQNNHDTAK